MSPSPDPADPPDPPDPPDPVRGVLLGTSRPHAPGVRMTEVLNKLPQINLRNRMGNINKGIIK